MKRGVKIAIIDNEFDARRILKRYIERYFVDMVIVGEAIDVKTGIELIIDKTPDIVLLDYRMDDGTACDVIQNLPIQVPEIILTTAFNVSDFINGRKEELSVLLKPIDPEKFIKIIHTVVNRLEIIM